ncbi:MAG: M23 family metallopeptidase [Desulfuromonadaceae bacterium]|nr:M23 family metallopeptidase [Desulfuromonadaceae bacterium]MDD5107113.1 M23 family metallopeptidase [Desulfuromonadaceae bacterium]
MPLLLLTFLLCPCAEADIYRFVTIDGVESFTDVPSDKSAQVIIKEQVDYSKKQRKSQRKQKTHPISLDEIVQKTVSASLNTNGTDQGTITEHLPVVGGTITGTVGMRIDPFDGVWRQHNGVDIAIPAGTPVKPVAPGVVVYCGSRSGYGNTVVVEHDNGIKTLYAHNSRIMATEGKLVTAESTLALSGSTGRSSGPHLHFEAWQAGSNITSAFLTDNGVALPKILVVSNQKMQRFRSEALSDGSILFTNIPPSFP